MNQCHPFASMRTAAADAFRVLRDRFERRGEATSMPSGFPTLDKLTGGLNEGELVVVVAEPGTGATALALAVIAHVALCEKRTVALFTMGTPCERIALRLISIVGKVEWNPLETGRLSDSDWPQISAAMYKLVKMPVFMDDAPVLSPAQICGRVHGLKADYTPRLVVIDGLQWLEGSGGQHQTDADSQRKGALMLRRLKSLAEELRLTVLATLQPWNCPVLTAAHPPTPQDLQQIGLDRRFVDVLACLFSRPCHEKRGHAEPFGLHVHGHRNRSSGTVALKFDPRCGKFDSLGSQDVSP